MTRQQDRYIDTQPALDELVRDMKEAARVALDTEADSLHSYEGKVCLIQLAFRNINCLIDPLASLDFQEFFSALSAKPLIIHNADYDLRMLRASFGFHAKGGVFDTAIGGQLLGFERLGLTALVNHFFGIELTKYGQKSDWSRRPLTPEQLKYARDDTRYLESLALRIVEELKKLGRLDWHSEACRNIVESTEHDAQKDPEDAWRVKGSSTLEPRQLAYLRELWNWREKEAKRADLPSFKILGNQTLIDLSVWASANRRRPLKQGPSLPRNCTGRRLRMLIKSVRKADNMPKHLYPARRKGKPGPVRQNNRNGNGAIFDKLRNECNRIADELHLAPSILAPRANLEAVARNRPRDLEGIIACGPMMRWQAQILEPAIIRVLSEYRD